MTKRGYTGHDSVYQQLARVKAEVKSREDTIAEKQQFLENEYENNREQEKRISLAERSAAKIRLDYQDTEAQRDQFASEVYTCRRYLNRVVLYIVTLDKTYLA